MPSRTLHVQLSPDAKATLEVASYRRNRAGQTLRDWLVRSFEPSPPVPYSQTSIFSTTIEVDDDVPLLLEALGRVTKRSPDELVEGWALEPPSDSATGVVPTPSKELSGKDRGKVAELIDLGETLFEETVSDARRKLGSSYPEGDKAAQVGASVFEGLRVLLGLTAAESTAVPRERGA